jgi:hypothetical protein
MAIITRLNGEKIEVDYEDIEPLRKEILYYFDQNMGDIVNAYVPTSDYKHKYWEFLNFEGTSYSYDDEESFFIEGCILILNGMICEYLDIEGGNQNVFLDIKLEKIIEYVRIFNPKSDDQQKMKVITLLGLDLAISITQEIIDMNISYDNLKLDDYFMGAKWIDQIVIQGYLFKKLIDVYKQNIKRTNNKFLHWNRL